MVVRACVHACVRACVRVGGCGCVAVCAMKCVFNVRRLPAHVQVQCVAVAVYCSDLQCVAVCCFLLQCT